MSGVQTAAAVDILTTPNWGMASITNAGNLSTSVTNVVPGTYSDDTPWLSASSNGINTTYVYSATINLASETQLQFFKHFDDGGYIILRKVLDNDTLGDAVVMINDTTWSSLVRSSEANSHFTAGEYYLEVRAGHGGSGNGPQGGSIGFGILEGYNASAVYTDFSKLDFDAGGNLAGIANITGVSKRFITADFTADTTLTGENAAANPDGNPVILAGKITGGTLTIDANATPFRINGGGSTGGNLSVTSGTVTLSAADGKSVGGINGISTGATVKLELADQTIIGGSGISGTINLNGLNLSSTGAFNTNTGSAIINNDGTNNAPLATLRVTGGNSTLNGTVGKPDGTDSNIAVDASDWFYLKNPANYYTGGTTARDGGAVYISSEASLGTGEITLIDKGFIGSDNASTHPQIWQKTTIVGSGGFTTAYGSPLTVTGQVTGNGDLLIAYGSGTVTLANDTNNYTGKTVIGESTRSTGDNATLALGVDNALPDSTALEFVKRNNGTSTLNMNTFNAAVTGISGTGRITSTAAAGSPSVLTLNIDDDSSSVEGISLSGNVKMVKEGTGTLAISSTTLSGSGVFELKEGNVAVNNPGLLAGSGTMNLTGTDTKMIVKAGNATAAAWGHSAISGIGNIRSATTPTDFLANPSATNFDITNGNHATGLWYANDLVHAYSTLVYISEPTNLQFLKAFDDTCYIAVTPVSDALVPGTTKEYLYQNNNWTNIYYSDVNEELPPGYYILDVRVANNSGGVGRQTNSDHGIGIKSGYSTSSSMTEFYGFDIVDGKIQIGADEYLDVSRDQIIGADFAIAGGSTFTIEGEGDGRIALNGVVSGEGALVLDSNDTTMFLNAANTHEGGTTLAGNFVINDSAAMGSGKITLADNTAMHMDATAVGVTNALNLNGKSFALTAEPGAGLFTGDISGGGKLVFDLDSLDASTPLYDLATLDLTALAFEVTASDPRAYDGETFWLLVADNFELNGNAHTLTDDGLSGLILGGPWSSGSGAYGGGTGIWITFDANKVPEPGTWVLMLLGAAGLCVLRKRNTAKA